MKTDRRVSARKAVEPWRFFREKKPLLLGAQCFSRGDFYCFSVGKIPGGVTTDVSPFHHTEKRARRPGEA